MISVRQADELVEKAFHGFFDAIATGNWWGHENEARSLYAFGHLAPFLDDPGQLCLDGAVRQGTGPGMKFLVNKDLVVWHRAGMSVWDANREPANDPLLVMEWNVGRNVASGDLAWLEAFSASRPGFVGFAVTLHIGSGYKLQCARVYRGKGEPAWLMRERG